MDTLIPLFRDKEFIFYLSCILITIILWIVYKLYVKTGLRKTIMIIVGIAAFIFVIYNIRIAMVQKYPYECANDIYYCEAYEYGDNINTSPVGHKYKVRYKYGKLTCINDTASPSDMVSYKVRLNHKEKKEFKQIFKKYNILGLIKPDESKKINDSKMSFNRFFYFYGHIGKAGFIYKRDNLPVDYQEFRKELWRFIFGKIDAPKFKREVEDTMNESNNSNGR